MFFRGRIRQILTIDHGFQNTPSLLVFVVYTELNVCVLYNRCTFTDHIKELDKDKGDNSLVEDKFLVICRNLALKMLSSANLHLVSVDLPVAANLDDATGLCLRFSSQLLSTSAPCLITITIEGRCSEPLEMSVKVNCEETVFGLNLLNRIVNVLVEPSHAHE